MVREVHELTLKQFVESTWFKLLARGAAVVGTLLAGGAGAYFLSIDVRVKAIEDERLGAKIEQLSEDVGAVKTDVAAVKVDVGAVKTDTSVMKGILQEMQRQDTAVRGGGQIASGMRDAVAPLP